MEQVKIDEEVLKCALNSLTINEITSLLENNEIYVSRSIAKKELINFVLEKLRNNDLGEELYIAIKTKAFSISTSFYEGFFYKYNTQSIDFRPNRLTSLLESIACKESKSNHSNIEFTYNFYNEEINEKENIISFTFFRESRRGYYDYKDEEVKFFHDKIQADVNIYFDLGIIYIHSKNLKESSAIKPLLQKALNEFKSSDENKKIKLYSPKFDSTIVEEWTKKNQINKGKISTTTIHMLDLLSEFDVEDNDFCGFEIKRIYLEHEVIDTMEDSKISGLIFWGENLQKRDEIWEEINKGKKIKGFDLQVEYIYEDVEVGDEITSKINISIVQENNSSIRIVLSDDILKKPILDNAYIAIKKVFLKKIISKKIENSDVLKEFICKCRDAKSYGSTKRDKGISAVY